MDKIYIMIDSMINLLEVLTIVEEPVLKEYLQSLIQLDPEEYLVNSSELLMPLDAILKWFQMKLLKMKLSWNY